MYFYEWLDLNRNIISQIHNIILKSNFKISFKQLSKLLFFKRNDNIICDEYVPENLSHYYDTVNELFEQIEEKVFSLDDDNKNTKEINDKKIYLELINDKIDLVNDIEIKLLKHHDKIFNLFNDLKDFCETNYYYIFDDISIITFYELFQFKFDDTKLKLLNYKIKEMNYPN